MSQRIKNCAACQTRGLFFEKDTICAACRNAINYGVTRQKADNEAALERAENQSVVWWKYCHQPSFFGIIRLTSEEHKRLQEVFKQLEARFKITEPRPGYDRYKNNEYLLYGETEATDRPTPIEMYKQDGELIRALNETFRLFGQMAYAQGKRDGTNLLANLASGDISFDQLNKRSIGSLE